MSKKLVWRGLVAVTTLVVATLSPIASAEMSYNAGVTSDYRFRGISQSAKDPALQGGADYTDKSGLYLGVWGSTIDFDEDLPPAAQSDADIEVDLYGGYNWKAGNVDWDAGAIYYWYPGSDSDFELNFLEVYFGGTFGPAFAKFYYSNDFTGPTDESAYYVTAGADFELGDGFALGVSVGRSDGDAFEDGYNDYKVGVSKEFAGFGFDLSLIGTDLDPEIESDVFNSEDTVVLTVTKSF